MQALLLALLVRYSSCSDACQGRVADEPCGAIGMPRVEWVGRASASAPVMGWGPSGQQMATESPGGVA